MNTSATAEQIIADINKTRLHYGFCFLTFDQEDAAVEEHRCDQIAEFWVRYKGGPKAWKANLHRIREAFTHRVGNIEFLDIVDTWEEDFGLTMADFDRLEPEIESSIKAHLSAYGRYKRILG